MKSSKNSSGPTKSLPKEPRGASGGQKAPRASKAGSHNTLGDGRTAGGGYNAHKRDRLADIDNEAGESHGDER